MDDGWLCSIPAIERSSRRCRTPDEPGGPYDEVIVTVNATDVRLSWVRQLTPSGRLVVPLRVRGHTRCLMLDRRGDHLVATAAAQCGFVAMQGDGRSRDRRLALRGDAVGAVWVLSGANPEPCDACHRCLIGSFSGRY
jgi:hypothetical protein